MAMRQSIGKSGIRLHLPEIVHRLRRAEKLIVDHVEASLAKSVSSLEKKVKSEAPSRSGRLAAALIVKLRQESEGAAGASWSVLVTTKKDGRGRPTPRDYFLQREFGGNIPRKAGKIVAIPIGRLSKRTDNPRIGPRQLIDNPGLLGYESTFKKKDIIFGSKGRGVRPVPLWKIRRGVAQSGSGYIAKSLKNHRSSLVKALRQAFVTIKRR